MFHSRRIFSPLFPQRFQRRVAEHLRLAATAATVAPAGMQLRLRLLHALMQFPINGRDSHVGEGKSDKTQRELNYLLQSRFSVQPRLK